MNAIMIWAYKMEREANSMSTTKRLAVALVQVLGMLLVGAICCFPLGLSGCSGGGSDDKQVDTRPRDSQDRPWNANAKVDPATGAFEVEASAAPPADPGPIGGAIHQLDANGNTVGHSDVTSHHTSGTLHPNAKRLVYQAKDGPGAISITWKLP